MIDCFSSRGRVFLSLTLAVLVAPSSANSQHANPYCGAILEQGIYDRSNEDYTWQKYVLAHKTHCSSSVSSTQKSQATSGEIGYKAFNLAGNQSESEVRRASNSFCGANLQKLFDSGLFRSEVTAINSGIVDAWTTCITDGAKPGMTHTVEIAGNPGDLVYTIQYSTGDLIPAETSLISFGVKGDLKCVGALPKTGDEVTTAGLQTVCTRDPSENIVFSALAEHGAQNVGFVVVQPHEVAPDIAEMSCVDFQHIHTGSNPAIKVACNPNTAPGYYWNVTQKLEHYSTDGLEYGGVEYPQCGPDQLGATAKTGRFPLVHSKFTQVHKLVTNRAATMTAPECNCQSSGCQAGYRGGHICGIFQAVCSKQPPS